MRGVNIAMDGVCALFLTALLVPLFMRKALNNRIHWCGVAQLTHILALLTRIASALYMMGRSSPQETAVTLYVSIVLDLCSLAAMVWCVLLDADGHCRLIHRSAPIAVSDIAVLIVPCGAALLVESLAPGLRPLGVGWALSLCLSQVLAGMQAHRDMRVQAQELDIQQARLLVEQIHPHFVSNSLMSIEQLCYTNPEEAAARIEDFAGYLRGNMNALTSVEPIPFLIEKQHIDQYIALERADPSRSFAVEWHLNETDFTLPALTVQPIVENAIKHGALRRDDGLGAVVVTTQAVGRFIRITVEDNGPGDAPLTQHQRESRRIGISNVETRIKKQCGGTFAIHPLNPGTRVVLTIPRTDIFG